MPHDYCHILASPNSTDPRANHKARPSLIAKDEFGTFTLTKHTKEALKIPSADEALHLAHKLEKQFPECRLTVNAHYPRHGL